MTLDGWLLEPEHGEPCRAFVVGHGYGGIEQPDFALPCTNAAYLVPCFRGLGLSRRAPISDNPTWHVLHDIDKPDRYIIGGCAQDLWIAVTALLNRFPHLSGRNGHLKETLAYYDAGSAARFIRQPMLVAAALFDPSVAPPTQFAIYNALAGPK
ncbi:MAG: acetylxylan esterase, partial [Chromatiaceae bacterium]|nr:acetylxylan esterase [Chromatiaceae bacterium]